MKASGPMARASALTASTSDISPLLDAASLRFVTGMGLGTTACYPGPLELRASASASASAASVGAGNRSLSSSQGVRDDPPEHGSSPSPTAILIRGAVSREGDVVPLFERVGQLPELLVRQSVGRQEIGNAGSFRHLRRHGPRLVPHQPPLAEWGRGVIDLVLGGDSAIRHGLRDCLLITGGRIRDHDAEID